MKTALRDYWLIWLSARRCPKAALTSAKSKRIAPLIWWLLIMTILILSFSIGVKGTKVVFLVVWFLATVVATCRWGSFLVGTLELNRSTSVRLVPKIRNRTIQLFMGTLFFLTMNTSILIWIVYSIEQNQFSVATYCRILLNTGTVISILSIWMDRNLFIRYISEPKQPSTASIFFIFFVSLLIQIFPKEFEKIILLAFTNNVTLAIYSTPSIGHLITFANDIALVIYSPLIMRHSINYFATIISGEVNEPNPIPTLHHQRDQKGLATNTKVTEASVRAMLDRARRRSGFGEKYILKPLTALLLCLDQRQTPRNALCLNLLELSNETSKVANGVHILYEILFVFGKVSMQMVIIGIICGNIYLITMALPYLTTPASSGYLILAPLGLIPIFNLRRYVNRITLTSKEQALVRLSPMLDSLSGLNQILAQIILRHSFFIWLKWTIITLLAAALLGTPATSLMMQLALCCMGLPFLGTILADYAADGQKQFAVARGWIGLFMALQLVLFIALFAKAGGKTPHIMLWLMGFIFPNITLALAIISIRWSKMMAAPIAFPAGRMGAK